VKKSKKMQQDYNKKISDLFIKYNNKELVLKKVDPRFNEWLTTIELIRENPYLGVGLNSRDILADQYAKNGYPYEASIRLNSHNQFLETQLAFGVPGTIILLWMLLTPLLRRKNSWDPDLVIPFWIIVFVSMLFESILVRQWGIMFFVLFYCILMIPDKAMMYNATDDRQNTLTGSNTY
jgi:O-antigen ligase